MIIEYKSKGIAYAILNFCPVIGNACGRSGPGRPSDSADRSNYSSAARDRARRTGNGANRFTAGRASGYRAGQSCAGGDTDNYAYACPGGGRTGGFDARRGRRDIGPAADGILRRELSVGGQSGAA